MLPVRARRTLFVGAVFCVALLAWLLVLEQSLMKKYRGLESVLVKDRQGEIISTLPNSKGEYSNYINDMPTPFKRLLIQKEDKYFYWHLGVNPVSTARALIKYMYSGAAGGSSTITQQLAKNLLGNENDRTVTNKIKELFYTLGLEVFKTKKSILAMYANTVYMGNNIQGFNQASIDYFGRKLEDLSEPEFISLLRALSNPSTQNPWRSSKKKPGAYIHTSTTAFELNSLGQVCEQSCTTTLDKELTEQLREILKRNVDVAWDSGARNGAIVVIKLPENELLAVVGSPNPANESNGHAINMAVEPRPIGSTAKPFIYLEAFRQGLRPYTEVEDREYKYPIATGYPLYPKNYDGLYHGTVTLHESLSNSYNVPTVKTLEYVGLANFYDFLEQKLAFAPLRDLDSYQFGIALGGLEMDPLTLAYYFSIFPEQGVLKPLHLFLERDDGAETFRPPMSHALTERKVADTKFTELVTKILSDRKTGVEQFGLKSNLNVTQDNYAVKTGTSRDYHDSWTVGYTPDYVVLVWLGNAENEPLKHVSGQSGAGRIWNEAMELLQNSPYNQKTPFAFDSVKAFLIEGNLDFGLPDDVVDEHRNLLLDVTLIRSPHSGDTILLEPNTSIPLRASTEATWYVNESRLGTGIDIHFNPTKAGIYRIRATAQNKDETIKIEVR